MHRFLKTTSSAFAEFFKSALEFFIVIQSKTNVKHYIHVYSADYISQIEKASSEFKTRKWYSLLPNSVTMPQDRMRLIIKF